MMIIFTIHHNMGGRNSVTFTMLSKAGCWERYCTSWLVNGTWILLDTPSQYKFFAKVKCKAVKMACIDADGVIYDWSSRQKHSLSLLLLLPQSSLWVFALHTTMNFPLFLIKLLNFSDETHAKYSKTTDSDSAPCLGVMTPVSSHHLEWILQITAGQVTVVRIYLQYLHHSSPLTEAILSLLQWALLHCLLRCLPSGL